MLKSPAMIVDLFISPFSSVSFCCMYFEALPLGTYSFRIFISIWCVYPLVTMICLPLPLIILLVLMSILSDFSIDGQLSYAYCLHGVLFFPFTFNLFITLYLKCISLRQHIVGSCWDAGAFSQRSCSILILQLFLCSYTSEGLSPHSCSSPSSDCFHLLVSAC